MSRLLESETILECVMSPPHTVFQCKGICPICERAVTFRAEHTWFRDHLKCNGCGSIPRERALMHVLTMLYPNWRKLAIHESSPVFRGASLKMTNECPGYVFSQYDEELGFGRIHSEKRYRSEDLERQCSNQIFLISKLHKTSPSISSILSRPRKKS